MDPRIPIDGKALTTSKVIIFIILGSLTFGFFVQLALSILFYFGNPSRGLMNHFYPGDVLQFWG